MSAPSQESIDAAVYRMTEWAYANSTILTNEGTMRFDSWLQRETARLHQKFFIEAWVQQNTDGRIALFKWNKDIRPIEGEDEK